MTGLPGAFDVGAVSTIMAEICASEMVPRFRNLSDSEIELKGVNDPVTVVDKKCEQLLSERLSQLFPEAGFVGEETYAADPSILSRLSEERPVWIVDPLDGTANFASGTAEFGMIVALASGGRTVAGWIHHPLTNATYHAVRGEGAFGPNGQLELPAPASSLESMTARFTIPRNGIDPGEPDRLKRLAGMIRQHGSTQCAAYAYAAIVDGSLDFLLFRRLMPWDHAAGILIAQEAGGRAAHQPSGQEYRVTDLKGPVLIAGNPVTYDAVAEQLVA